MRFSQVKMIELTEYLGRRLITPDGNYSIWGDSLLNAYSQVSRFSSLPPVAWTGNRNCIVYGSRIFNKLTPEGRRESHLVLSARDPLRLIDFPRSFSYDLKAYREVYSAIRYQRDNLLIGLQSRISQIIQKAKPKIFVANSTIDPINRLWLQIARELGAKTCCLQHGVYAKEAPDYALEEDIVDKYIALDKSQATIVGRNIDARKISLLGECASFEWNPPSKEMKVCFVGEDWERYGYVDFKELVVRRYMEIMSGLRQRGVSSFFYKPHPSEQNFFGIDRQLPMLKNKDVNSPDVYIGFSSSFLKDMSSRGKLAIQIFEEQLKADNFSLNGYCVTIPNDRNLIEALFFTMKNRQIVPCIRERRLEDLLY